MGIKPCPFYVGYYWCIQEECDPDCAYFDSGAANMRDIPVEPAEEKPLTCKDCKNYKTDECYNVYAYIYPNCFDSSTCHTFVLAK